MAPSAGDIGVEVRQPNLPDSMDRDLVKDIMIYRSLGYQQREIADALNTSQQTVSRHLKEINSMARDYDDPRSVFYGMFLAIFLDLIREKVFSESSDSIFNLESDRSLPLDANHEGV